MRKKASKTKKKMTIETLAEKIGEVASSVEDLAIMTQKGFKSLENKLVGRMDEKIDSLAIMTQSQFERIDERFEKIDERFNGVENRLENLDLGQKKIHQEILNIHDSFVKRSEFDNLVQILSRVE